MFGKKKKVIIFIDGSENNHRHPSWPFQIVHVSSYKNFMLILCLDFLHIKEKTTWIFLKLKCCK